jgi:hypothetical protein
MIGRVTLIVGLLLACLVASSPLWSKGAVRLTATPAQDAAAVAPQSSSHDVAALAPGSTIRAEAGVAKPDVEEGGSTETTTTTVTDTTTEFDTTTVTDTSTEVDTTTTTVTDTEPTTVTDTATTTVTDTAPTTLTDTTTTTVTDTEPVTDTTTTTVTDTEPTTVTDTATTTDTVTSTPTTTDTVTSTDTATDTTTATETVTATDTTTVTSTAASPGGGGSVVSAGPSAAFTWLPVDPHVGQLVSLLSTSTAGSSALSSYAWQIDGGPFSSGPLARSVTFSTPGSHLVALRVTDAGGRSSLVSNTIPVSSREVTLMQPFPIVHVAGSYSHDGAALRMLSVQAPAGATVVVECSGTGCPARRQRRSVPTGDGAAATIGFAGFERSLPAGLTLKVKVFAEGEIGKLTRLVIRRGKPPARSDTCLEPSGLRATGCPA